MRMWRQVEDLFADARYAARLCLRSPAFTFVVVLTIGLAIGMNAAAFSVVNAVLLKTLPVRDADRLVFLNVAAANGKVRAAPPFPCYERFRDASALSGMAAFTFDRMTVTIDGRPEKVMGQRASVSYFDVLGVTPALGRTFVPSDERLEPAVAVLGYQYWQRRFGGEASVIGRTITYQDRTFTVVGVSARDFSGLEAAIPVDITVPINVVGQSTLQNAGRWWFDAIARLSDGATREQAMAQVDTVFQTFMQEQGATAEDRKRAARMELTPAMRGMTFLRTEFGEPLLFVLGIAGLVLLIACANVANLLLARAVARRHEFATRVAVGASRSRLVRQLLVESLFLSLLGTALGLILAQWLLGLLAAPLAAATLLPVAITLDVRPDARFALFAALLCVATSVLFGLAPARRAARTDAASDLKQRAGLGLGRRFGFSTGMGLVVVQIALSLALLVATGLLVSTLGRLRSVDVGFRAEGVSTYEVELLPTKPPRDPIPRWTELLARVEALPGVRSASVAWLLPLGQRDRGVGVKIPGSTAPAGSTPGAVLNHVSPDFFATMGIPVGLGRAFTARDDARAPLVAVINHAAARAYFGGASPIGQRIEIGSAIREIVGVAADVKHLTVRDDMPRIVYVPVWQPVDRMTSLTLAVRGSDAAGGQPELVRREIAALGSDVFVGRVSTMSQQIDRSLVRERFLSTVSAAFGLLGVLLAAVGIYGVMSFTMLRRKQEIAVRMALGASASDVSRRVLRQSMLIAAIGIVIGLPISIFVARLLSGVLFGVRPADPLILAACAAALVGIAAIAAYVPARRASRVDPMTVLKSE
jgi:predicted permease